MSLPNEFFTLASFATLGGATGIVIICVTIVDNLSQKKLPLIQLRWIAFVLSELVSFFGAFYAMAKPEGVPFPVRLVIAALNGGLIFVTALGLNTGLTKPDGAADPAKMRKFLRRW